MGLFESVIVKYWIEWVCAIFATAISFGARHYVKLQRASWERRIIDEENRVKHEVVEKLEREIKEVRDESNKNDESMRQKMTTLFQGEENMTLGLLSVQGKQFREFCIYLLSADHVITIAEYEQFEEDYRAYKALKGNHRGDALHDRVVEKFSSQVVNGK